jgi:dihydrodipicolinate synthase/N-acetylneuraminate lyase
MPTSSITKNFIVSDQEQAEMLVEAMEASARNRPVLISVSAREITDEAEFAQFIAKWEKENGKKS